MNEQERFETASQGIRRRLRKNVPPQFQFQRLINYAVSNLNGTTRVELKELMTFIATREEEVTDELERISIAEKQRSKLKMLFGNNQDFEAEREQMMDEYKLCVIINNACLRIINNIDNEEERNRRLETFNEILPIDRGRKKA